MEFKILSDCWRCAVWNFELPRFKKIESPIFNLAGCDWQIELTGCYDREENCEAWEVRLTKFRLYLYVRFSFYIENGKGEIELVSDDRSTFLIRRKRLTSLGIWGDKITLFFQLDLSLSLASSILEEEFIKQKKENSEKLADHLCLLSLSEDIGKLFDKEEHSDTILRCGDRSFSVSKKILCARSEVFAAMFRYKMSESETGSVDITDMDPPVLEQFLRYLYSAKVDGLSMDSVFDLYRAGDKYAIPSLKRKCASFMLDILSEENVCEILSLAGTFEDAELLDGAISFAVSRPEFLVSDKWTAFAESQPAVAVKVFLRYNNQRRT